MQVHFIIASCENMIDGKGMRPGDVLTAMNGKTVEVSMQLFDLPLYACIFMQQKQAIPRRVYIAI